MNRKYVIIFFGLIIFSLLFYFYLESRGKTIAIISQNEAETVQGIQIAAKNAKIKFLEDQAVLTAKEIAELKNKEPEYVVETVIKEVNVVSEEERKKNKADFAIITKPDNPDYRFDINDFNSNDPVILNQYNIKAYKKNIVGIAYYPNKFASVDYSKKISNNGHYLGLGILYDLKENKSYFGVRYTF